VDFVTLSSKFNGLNSTGKGLLKEADDNLVPTLKARIFKLNSHWNETLKKAKEQNVFLKEGLEKSKNVSLRFKLCCKVLFWVLGIRSVKFLMF